MFEWSEPSVVETTGHTLIIPMSDYDTVAYAGRSAGVTIICENGLGVLRLHPRIRQYFRCLLTGLYQPFMSGSALTRNPNSPLVAVSYRLFNKTEALFVHD